MTRFGGFITHLSQDESQEAEHRTSSNHPDDAKDAQPLRCQRICKPGTGIKVGRKDEDFGSEMGLCGVIALLSARLVSNLAFVGCSTVKILPVAIKCQRIGTFCMSVMRCSCSTLLFKEKKKTKPNTMGGKNAQIPSFPLAAAHYAFGFLNLLVFSCFL